MAVEADPREINLATAATGEWQVRVGVVAARFFLLLRLSPKAALRAVSKEETD